MLNNTEFELHKSSNPWIPTHRLNRENNEVEKYQDFQRRITGVLNKLTPTKFATLVEQVKQMDISNERCLNCVVDLLFENAILSQKFTAVYATMCEQLCSLIVPLSNQEGSVEFKSLLLDKCQKEFEKDRKNEVQIAERSIQQEELEEIYMKTKRRLLGNIRFIGQLFEYGILPEAIIFDYITLLLENADELSLECLCCLITVAGKSLENEHMQECIAGIHNMQEKFETNPRIKYMLQDVIELQQRHWVLRRHEDLPKTIDQVHQEAYAQYAM